MFFVVPSTLETRVTPPRPLPLPSSMCGRNNGRTMRLVCPRLRTLRWAGMSDSCPLLLNPSEMDVTHYRKPMGPDILR